MAVDMFLKLEGVAGEPRDKVHPKDIDVLSFSWGTANSKEWQRECSAVRLPYSGRQRPAVKD
jgi:type VI protein secretion system component Hcp